MVFMKKKDLIFSLLAMLGLVCVGGWHFISQNQAQAVKAEARKTIYSIKPSNHLFPWLGAQASHAERHMANVAKKSGVTQTIIEAMWLKMGPLL